MSAFKAVVFDYDGTLYDTRPAIVHCIQRTFAECGRPAPAHESMLGTVRAGLPLHDTFLALDATLHDDLHTLDEMVRIYRTLYFDEAAPLLKPFRGVRETLERIHVRGVKCVVVSNKGVAAVRRSLDEGGLGAFVDLIYGDEAGLPKKPDPAVLTDHILPKFVPMQKDQILMVGDTETDIVFAKRTGVAVCWVSYGYGAIERCRSLAPEYEIASLAELPALVSPS